MREDFDLAGRVVLITGVSKGIGAETARRIAALGGTVVAGDIDRDGAERTAANIIAAGGRAEIVDLDVTQEAQWDAALAHVRTTHGRLDGLVNNAGIILMKPTELTTLEDWRRVNAINVEGTFLGIRTALPLLRDTAQGRSVPTSIVNLSSVYGITGSAGFAAYCASKGAVRMLTKACALEFGRNGDNVRVNSVHPGPIDTDLGVGPLKELEAQGVVTVDEGKAVVRERYPLGRWGEPEDIARAVVFLLTDASAFMTGSELVVDGGWTAD